MAHDIDLTSNANEWVFGRLVAVGGGIGGRALNVRIVIGRAGAQVDDFDAELNAKIDKLESFGQIIFDGMILVGAEAIAVWQAVGEFFRYAGT